MITKIATISILSAAVVFATVSAVPVTHTTVTSSASRVVTSRVYNTATVILPGKISIKLPLAQVRLGVYNLGKLRPIGTPVYGWQGTKPIPVWLGKVTVVNGKITKITVFAKEYGSGILKVKYQFLNSNK